MNKLLFAFSLIILIVGITYSEIAVADQLSRQPIEVGEGTNPKPQPNPKPGTR